MEPTKFEYEVQAQYGSEFSNVAGFIDYLVAKEYADMCAKHQPDFRFRVICTVTNCVEYEA